MNTIFSTAGRLALLCGVAGLLLAVTYIGLSPAIAASSDAVLNSAVKTVSGGASVGAAVNVTGRSHVVLYYPLAAGSTSASGYVLLLRGEGYAGEINLVARYAPSGEVVQARFFDRHSGPPAAPRNPARGLLRAFEGKNGAAAGPTQAVSGATVSFIAARQMLAAGSDFVRSLGAKE